MSRELVVLLNGEVAGRVWQQSTGMLGFEYDRGWQEREDGYPLSLSLPLAQARHEDRGIRAYLEGLLPDNFEVLRQWGRQFHVSPNNPFALLAHVGEDCAGAVQLVAPERAGALRRSPGTAVQWLTETEIEERLFRLSRNQAAWREPGDAGYFSLAGAQPKIALLWNGEKWGIPSGRTPTTHILKPPVLDLNGFVENEHVCLHLARVLGLPAAGSEVRRFGDQVAIVVERHDRLVTAGGIRRIHQEDFCQALGVSPRIKYEQEGGPGIAPIIEVLRTHSDRAEEDEATLVDALALNWAIAGTDAHAKNYSLLIAEASQVRLAPLYDVVSALPYPREFPPRKIRLAMRVGGEYTIWKIGRRHWERFAAEVRLDGDSVVQRVRDLVTEVPDRLQTVRREAEEQGIIHPVLTELQDRVADHVRACLRALDGPGAP